MSTHKPQRRDAPRLLKRDNRTAKIIYRDMWRAANVENDWFMFAIVGREGTGKSLTCASILQHADPTFSADRVHWSAESFVEQLEQDNDAGTAIMADEAGAWLGNRTWHDSGQVKLNQLLQTARDDNLIIGLTLPRLEELDVQTEGRLHAILRITNDAEADGFAKFTYKYVKPSREGEDEMWRKYPREAAGGQTYRITSLSIGPPSQSFIDPYERQKAAFKADYYEETRQELADEDEDETDIQSIVERAESEFGVDHWIREASGVPYLDRDLLMMEFDLTNRESRMVKKQLIEKHDLDCN